MTQEEFGHHLAEAARRTLVFTRSWCWNRLSDHVDFLIQPDNLDNIASYLSPLEWAHFQARKQEIGQRFSAAEVVERLWVGGQVPAYINITVYRAARACTTLELLIDRRLGSGDALYHHTEGVAPFHVLVSLPPYAGVQDRFHANWRHWPWHLQLLFWRGWWQLQQTLRLG